MEANAADSLAFGIETEDEQRDVAALFEFLAMQCPLEAVATISSLTLVKIDLPEIGSLERVVTLESDAGQGIDVTCAIPISAVHRIGHNCSSPSSVGAAERG